MGRSLQQPLPEVEANRVEDGPIDPLNKVEALQGVEMRMAKAGFGAAVARAIGDEPTKHYGDKGWISNVLSGAGVPEYLAKIWANPAARRRFALALLKGDRKVKVRMVVEIEE